MQTSTELRSLLTGSTTEAILLTKIQRGCISSPVMCCPSTTYRGTLCVPVEGERPRERENSGIPPGII